LWRVLFEEYGIQHVEEALLLAIIAVAPIVALTAFGPAIANVIASAAALIPSP